MTHQNNEENDGDYADLTDKLRQILASESQLGELEERRELVVEELNRFSITKDVLMKITTQSFCKKLMQKLGN